MTALSSCVISAVCYPSLHGGEIEYVGSDERGARGYCEYWEVQVGLLHASFVSSKVGSKGWGRKSD